MRNIGGTSMYARYDDQGHDWLNIRDQPRWRSYLHCIACGRLYAAWSSWWCWPQASSTLSVSACHLCRASCDRYGTANTGTASPAATILDTDQFPTCTLSAPAGSIGGRGLAWTRRDKWWSVSFGGSCSSSTWGRWSVGMAWLHGCNTRRTQMG